MNLPRLIVPKRHADERGWFSETFHEARLRALGIADRFVQDNQSWSRRAGTLRGLHAQCAPAAQAKLVSVLRGRVFDVAVDIRRGSPTFGRHVAAELTDANGRQLYVPAGFAHGFITLADDVIVNYKVSHVYAPAQERGIRWDDPDIGIPWPMKRDDIILSARDRALPALQEFDSPFAYDDTPLGPLPEAAEF